MRQPLKEATADVSTDRGLRRAGRQSCFDRRYTDEHVPLVKAVPRLGVFQLSHPQGGTPYLVAELLSPSEDAFKASAATHEMAELRPHAEGCGTTFTVYTGDVAEV